MVLSVTNFGKSFSITLDSGATVSFISKRLCEMLGLEIRPNGQLATLADPRYQVRSIGEVDCIVTEKTTGKALLRLRALVMDRLAVDCYGGTTFHLDNHLVPDITLSLVRAHGDRFVFHLPPHGKKAVPPPCFSVATDPFICSTPAPLSSLILPTGPEVEETRDEVPVSKPTGESILMRASKTLLPEGTYSIPLKTSVNASSVIIQPSTPRLDTNVPAWDPQVCEVVSNCAVYTNHSHHPLSHPKNTHFKAIPMCKKEDQPSMPLKPKQALQLPPANPESILSQFKINTSLLSTTQQDRLKEIHIRNISAFNEDMSAGFSDSDNPYSATFSFRKESRPPPFKNWVPQYNQKCQDLLQAKFDQLEQQGVMVDPMQHNINIRLVSPCFIAQKARAKHKPLEQCSLDEVRFITCYNVLNDSIHPISGRSNSYNNILTFFGRWKYLIFADLSSSYFQIKVDKKHWKYLGVMSPHRGIRVMTRLGQGQLNSDVDLDQVLSRVLGDEQTAGFCMAARDDIFVGGDSVEDCIANWDTVLTKLNQKNLKLNPRKVRIMMGDAEVFGHRLVDGTIQPSDHIISSLAATTPADLVTVKQVNSWKGLYKTLIRHLPHLAMVMLPFDRACASKLSSSKFDWGSPGILAAFNTATSHLKEIQATYLPRPDEQLILQPDTSSSELCTGWALYTIRKEGKDEKWLPVQYASAKLPNYMAGWSPCEKEGVGAVVAIDQVRHWINESRLTTIVMPDNKPVVDAAALMKLGRHSTSSRLQQLLASVNRSNIKFRHNSAKAGLHTVPDALSRRPRATCGCKDCQVERFLDDIPASVQFMPITLSTLTTATIDPATLAAIAPDMKKLLGPGAGPIPLGSRETWVNLQSDCGDCARFLSCKKEGQMPGPKDKDKAVLNKLFKHCEVARGLIVSKAFDPIQMKEVERIYVPAELLEAILTIMHVRLDHPLPTQLQRMFEKYFISFRVKCICETISAECSLCNALKKFPKELDSFSPSPGPLHPGSHMNADVLRRASQYILVNVDRFSNFVTASFTASESRDEMVQGILNVITPVRHSSTVQVRTDRARALSSLAQHPDPQLADNGIDIVLGDHGNKNSNAAVDKAIQELESELRHLSPEGNKISTGDLSQAVTNLNNRIRGHGLTASQVHFSRDSNSGTNLAIKDEKLWQVREARKAQSTPPARPPPKPVPGQTVFLKSEGSKHTAREPLLVTKVENKITVQRIKHTNPLSATPPRITSIRQQIDPKFLYIPPHRRSVRHDWGGQKEQTAGLPRPAPPPPLRPQPWLPSRPPSKQAADDDVIFVINHYHDPAAQVDQPGDDGVGEGEDDEEGEPVAEDEEEMADAGGGEVAEEEGGDGIEADMADIVGEGADNAQGEVEGVDDQQSVQVQYLPLPAAMHGPRQRRRPPREQLILRQPPAGEPDLVQPAVAAQPQPAQALSRSGRTLKPPDRLGFEKDRADEFHSGPGCLNISAPHSERELELDDSSTAISSDPGSLATSPKSSPASTPHTSPDTSAIDPPDPAWVRGGEQVRGRSARERAQDILERHRHWSDPGPEVTLVDPRTKKP